MTKSDKSKHNITIASIKRSTIKPYNFKFTRFYENNSEFLLHFPHIEIKENELIICSTIINSKNYTVLTTQKIITAEKGLLNIVQIDNVTSSNYGEFKNTGIDYTYGCIKQKNGDINRFLIETGKASMIMINGIKTLFKIS